MGRHASPCDPLGCCPRPDAPGLLPPTSCPPSVPPSPLPQRLVTEALARGSRDNVAVAVAVLRPAESGTAERVYHDGRLKYG